MPNDDSEKVIFITSLVRSKTMQPAVQIEIGEVKTQISAEKAREVALMILEASESAMSDAWLVQFLVEKTGAPVDQSIGIIMQEFRAYRDAQREKEK